MNNVAKIREIWENEQDVSLSQILPHLINLLEKAKANQEEVPLELELDILLAASYAIDFGSDKESLEYISNLMFKIFTSIADLEPISDNVRKKISRLTSVLTNSVFGSLINDVQNNLTETKHACRQVLGINSQMDDTGNPLTDVLPSFGLFLMQMIDLGLPDIWYVENISDLITIVAILQNFPDQPLYSEYTQFMQTERTKLPSDIIEKWKNSFPHRSEKYRFISIMLNLENPLDKHWKDIADGWLI